MCLIITKYTKRKLTITGNLHFVFHFFSNMSCLVEAWNLYNDPAVPKHFIDEVVSPYEFCYVCKWNWWIFSGIESTGYLAFLLIQIRHWKKKSPLSFLIVEDAAAVSVSWEVLWPLKCSPGCRIVRFISHYKNWQFSMQFMVGNLIFLRV